MKNFIIFVALCLASVVSFTYHGYVFATMWEWFVVPYFSLPQVSVPLAVGLFTMIGFATKPVDMRIKDERELYVQIIQTAVLAVLYPSFVLFIGWVAKGFL